jgi:hypothetical protein
MAVDMFLVIPPATGNPPMSADPVTDQYFKTTFPNAAVVGIRQFSVGAENPASVGSAATGAGTGKAVLTELLIEKSVDTMSRALFALSATGGHLAKMQLYLRKAGVAEASRTSSTVSIWSSFPRSTGVSAALTSSPLNA